MEFSEFAHKLGQSILKAMYDGLYKVCEKLFDGMFAILDGRIAESSQMLQQTPEAWNSAAYNTVKSIAENAFVPMAGVFIACILVWELVHLLQQSNQMGSQIFEKLIVLLFSSAICVYLCSHSFDIVMYFFELGANVTGEIAHTSWSESFDRGLDLLNFLPKEPVEYDAEMIFELMGDMILLFIGNIAILICSAIMYVRVVMWFLEFLIYVSAASIPNATWMNREWSQVGMNYTRKMLAVAFEGPFMLLLFAIYGGVLSGVDLGDFKQAIVMIIGCGFALICMMFKVGNITSSIFNAH
ncbi:MAG: hypothetical protein HFI50_12595 [Lachnospiraceae bacterium]|jgi:hypothetical protein|nr:hypothetical protein [Lachnospiraceae bacterium]